MQIINPATGDTIREIAEDTGESIAEKFKRAKKAQPAWSATALSSRREAMVNFRNLLVDRKEELAAILTGETGKPVRQALGEISATTERIDFFVDNVAAVIDPVEVLRRLHQAAGDAVEPAPAVPKLVERISYEPLGVVGNISAWNYPYFVGGNVFIPALLTGNVVLYKPSEFASQTGLAIVDLLHRSGIPKDVIIPIVGGGSVGAQLLAQPLNGIFFTGSYATGVKVAQAAAARLMKVQLELGGKDPVYVCDDVDVATAAASLADGAFYNAGQSCCSVERIYVHRSVYEAFLAAFLEAVRGFVMGDPKDPKTYLGPVTRAEHLPVLEAQVADALEKGARLLVGGKRREGPGNFFEATVLADTNHHMLVMREESFGPVIGITPVDSDEEAVALMNDTEYGLTSGVYSKNAARAEAILAQMNTGTTYWNCCDRVSPRLPWTGRGHSGIGSTLSLAGIAAFVQPKAWHLTAP